VCALRHSPVFRRQTSDALEFAVVRHENQSVRQGDGGDQEIVRADYFTTGFERITNLGVLPGCRIIKGQRTERCEGVLDPRYSLNTFLVLPRAVQQLGPDYRAHRDVLGRRLPQTPFDE